MFDTISSLECTHNTQHEGYDGIVLLHWLMRKIPSYQILQYLAIGLKHKP